MKDLNESAALSAFRMKFEAGRSFELEDDLEFCPNLLTETDVSSDGGCGIGTIANPQPSLPFAFSGLLQSLTRFAPNSWCPSPVPLSARH